MSDDTFVHNQEEFDPVDVVGGVEVDDLEAKYADLFCEVIWDGVITPEKRTQLRNAAKIFGLGPVRARQIEDALTEIYKQRNDMDIVEEPSAQRAAGSVGSPRSIAPLAPAKDPRLLALQRRIDVLEQRNDGLQQEHDALAEHNTQLEQLVDQLQSALESTLHDLDQTSKKLDSLEQSSGPRSTAKPVDDEAPASSEVLLDDEAPESSVQPLSKSPRGEVSVSGAAEPAITPNSDPDASQARARPSRSTGRKRWRSRRVLRDSSVPPAPLSDGGGLADRAVQRSRARLPSERPGKLRASRGDPAEIHRLVRLQPRDPELLRALYAALQRADDVDRRWCIAHTLSHLGEANEEEQATFERYATTGLIKPKRAVNEDEWRELLFHPQEDLLTGAILAEIAPAVLLGHAPSIRASITPDVADPSQRVDPRESTVQAARCFAWAAPLLGLAAPPLYAAPEDPGIATLLLDPKPATRLGAKSLVGRSARELAFIAGRHLSWYRKEHLLGWPSRSLRRLEDMFVAALTIGNPGLPITPEIKERVEPIARTIRPLLDDAAVERLREYFGSFVEDGGRTNLVTWIEAADRTSACTGMLLCNDLSVARAMLELEDKSRAAERMDELIVFFTAGRCSLLRKRIGIAIEADADE